MNAPPLHSPVRITRGLRRRAGRYLRKALGWQEYGRVSYSQEGEDLVVAKLFEASMPNAGFYVDVGAHHPFRYSNTYYFYQRGWRGINIDPRNGMKEHFDAHRPRDLNLEIAIAQTAGSIEFVEFNEPALSGCDMDLAASRNGHNGHNIIGRRAVQAEPLSAVFEAHLPPGQRIDFLTIDIEGLDVQALTSNNWERWRPTLVIAEDGAVVTTGDIEGSGIAQMMRSVGYSCISKLGLSAIFAEETCIHRTELGVRIHV
jgi:FkbM family methyltransferase